jgi:hypothetical protein
MAINPEKYFTVNILQNITSKKILEIITTFSRIYQRKFTNIINNLVTGTLDHYLLLALIFQAIDAAN